MRSLSRLGVAQLDEQRLVGPYVGGQIGYRSNTSERRLMEMAAMNLAHHWYLGYDLDEPLPDLSSLSKIRGRYGVEAFQHFFERIVELCMEAGLVEGEELYFDATK